MSEKGARPKFGNEPWRVRFSLLTPELSVQLGLVFIGPSALIADSVLDWPADFKHYQNGDGKREPVCKLYIQGDRGQFPLPDLDPLLYRVTYVDWTFLRSQDCRAVCAPRPIPRHYLSPDVLASVDIDSAEKAFWGFGRPNAYKPGTKVHQTLSGSVVDYIPGREPENRHGWVFAPVFIKVQPNGGGRGYIAKLYPIWPGNNSVIMTADMNPGDFPQELVDYDFGPRANERPSGADTANEGLAALASNAVRHRR